MPALIPPQGRERLLREAHYALKRENLKAQFEWYTPQGEKLLRYLLAVELRNAKADAESPTPRRGKQAAIDLDALWLLCRASMGAIEAALLELGKAYARVERLRHKWNHVNAGSPSLVANRAVTTAAGQLRRKVHSTLRLGGAPSTKPVLPSQQESGGASSPTGAHDDDDEDEDELGLKTLGSDQTRLGLGIRRRALLRSQQALACHAGALHDLRVLLHDVGGEWLELGRWVGGPPLSSMPWDAQPCRSQLEHLLAACSRIVEQVGPTPTRILTPPPQPNPLTRDLFQILIRTKAGATPCFTLCFALLPRRRAGAPDWGRPSAARPIRPLPRAIPARGAWHGHPPP